MNKKVLIISDGKPGHLNQSIAFCKLKNLSYDKLEFKPTKMQKFFYYIFAFFGYYPHVKIDKKYDAIISTGSSTYYVNLCFAKSLKTKSIAIMLPSGFRYKDFNTIIANSHDNPPCLTNIIEIPINLSYNEPKGDLQKRDKKAIGVIIGGSNDVFKMQKVEVKLILDEVFKEIDTLKYLTTSRRTSKEIEDLCESYAFDYKVIYSKTPDVNPISDFIEVCDEIYITMDSTSMISEIKANTNAKINIIELSSKTKDTKFHRLLQIIKNIEGKVDLKKYLDRIEI